MSFCPSFKMSMRCKQKPPVLRKQRIFKGRKLYCESQMSILMLLKLILHQTQIFLQKSEIINLCPSFKSEHQSKTDFNRSRSSSSKSSLISSSNFLISSFARGTYLSVIKKLKQNGTSKTFSSSSRRTLKMHCKIFRKMCRPWK